MRALLQSITASHVAVITVHWLQQCDWLRAVSQSLQQRDWQQVSAVQSITATWLAASSVTIDYSNVTSLRVSVNRCKHWLAVTVAVIDYSTVTSCKQCCNRLQQLTRCESVATVDYSTDLQQSVAVQSMYSNVTRCQSVAVQSITALWLAASSCCTVDYSTAGSESRAVIDYSTALQQCYSRLQQLWLLRAVSRCNVINLTAASSVTVDYSNVTSCKQSQSITATWLLRAVTQSITNVTGCSSHSRLQQRD